MYVRVTLLFLKVLKISNKYYLTLPQDIHVDRIYKCLKLVYVTFKNGSYVLSKRNGSYDLSKKIKK